MLLENKSANIAFSFDEVKGIFTGYASVFNEVDRINDMILDGAYDEEIKSWESGKKIPVNFEHEKSIRLADNLNKMVSDPKGLLVEWTFSQEAKSQYPDIWHWALSKAKSGNLFMSIGFIAEQSELGMNRKSLKRQLVLDKISQISLDHIAATANPVDTKAKILEVKGFRTPKYPVDLSDSWDAQAANKRWREYTKSTEIPSAQYKNGFLYIEDGREDLFGSYHFQVVDIIDGEPMINQQAVITANAYLRGAGRGVKILNEQEKKQALTIISTLYMKINRLRKQEGVDELPEVEIKSEEANLNYSLRKIDGKVTAKKFLKENKSIMSNNNVENFVNHLFSLNQKSLKVNEAVNEPQCKAQASVSGGNTNNFDSLLEQVAIKLKNK